MKWKPKFRKQEREGREVSYNSTCQTCDGVRERERERDLFPARVWTLPWGLCMYRPKTLAHAHLCCDCAFPDGDLTGCRCVRRNHQTCACIVITLSFSLMSYAQMRWMPMERRSDRGRRTRATRRWNWRRSSTSIVTWHGGGGSRSHTVCVSPSGKSRSGSRTGAWNGKRYDILSMPSTFLPPCITFRYNTDRPLFVMHCNIDRGASAYILPFLNLPTSPLPKC